MDDNYFPGMYHENVYYINVRSYYHYLDFKEMCGKFYKSDTYGIIFKNVNLKEDEFIEYMLNEFKLYDFKIILKADEDLNMDRICSKSILQHLHDFFTKSQKNKTRINAIKKYKKNKTQKLHK